MHLNKLNSQFFLPEPEESTVSSGEYQVKELVCSSLNTRTTLSSMRGPQHEEYMGNEIKWQNSRITSPILQMLTPEYTLARKQYFKNIFTLLLVRTFWTNSFSSRVKGRLNGNPNNRALQRDRKSFLSPEPSVCEKEPFLLFPREDVFTFQSSVPSLHLQKGRWTEVPAILYKLQVS